MCGFMWVGKVLYVIDKYFKRITHVGVVALTISVASVVSGNSWVLCMSHSSEFSSISGGGFDVGVGDVGKFGMLI